MSFQKRVFGFAYRQKKNLVRFFPKPLLRAAKRLLLTKKKYQPSDIMPFQRELNEYGINLVGSLKAETGLGQSSRLIAGMIKHCGIACSLINYEVLNNSSQQDESLSDELSNVFKYNVNLIHINPQEWSVASVFFAKENLDHRYNIAFWLWELEELPKKWIPLIDYFDEIWTPSEFISRSLRKVTKKPVTTIPYALPDAHFVRKDQKENDRDFFHLPKNRFLFLTMYDCNSIQERKNPRAVIKAFREAFPKNDEKVGLVLKVSSAGKKQLRQLKKEFADSQNVYLLTEIYKKEKVDQLLSCVNVVVSLHRAEGFGLVMAEAMLHGTPVIATGWSANMEFMTKENACITPYQLVKLKHRYGPFEKGQRWAEADLLCTIAYMQKLFLDKELYDNLQRKGREDLLLSLSLEKNGKLLLKRYKEIVTPQDGRMK